MSSDAAKHVLVETKDGIQLIRFNRPEKKNALTVAMYEAVCDALDAAAADDAVRVVFFTGNQDCFTSGNDLLDFMNAPPADENSPVIRFLKHLATFEKPMVAAVAGPAVGVGVTMLLHCDLVYAAPDARMQMPFVNLGLCPEAGSSLLLPRLMGHQRAAELLLLGERFDGARARELGLVNAVFSADTLEQAAWEQARRLAAQPPASVRISKRLMKAHGQEALRAAMEAEGGEFLQRLGSPEAAEAFQAFMERRKPDFSRFV